MAAKGSLPVSVFIDHKTQIVQGQRLVVVVVVVVVIIVIVVIVVIASSMPRKK